MSEDRQVTVSFITQEVSQEYMILTDDTPVTLVFGSDTIVYGSQGANVITLESGAVATLKKVP